jgi:hypothetical protein
MRGKFILQKNISSLRSPSKNFKKKHFLFLTFCFFSLSRFLFFSVFNNNFLVASGCVGVGVGGLHCR